MRNIPLFKVFMASSAPDAVGDVLRSGYIGQGPKVDYLEAELKKEFQNDYVLSVNSCTSSLQLALHLIKSDDDPRDEVIVTPLTCFATITAILENGYKVRWADVNPADCNIDLVDVERKVGPNTKAVMVVHWGGYPVNLEHLGNIKKAYEEAYGKPLHVIEDCAHCWNAKYRGDLIGNSGNYCCFSFQAIKFLTTADGGLLITPDAENYKRGKLMRWFGLDREAGASFRCIQDITEYGFKYHLHDVGAAIGLSNLPYIAENVRAHQKNAAYLREHLADMPGVTNLCEDSRCESSYWIYTMLVEERKEFMRAMEGCGIMASPVHARCDKHTCVERFKSFLPGMDWLESRHISIPCGWWVTQEDLEYMIECIRKGW
jgi:dTDP-4-amino-4,6-dideoxy-D-glucose/dTDP-4-amino-2,4-dideoxy-beta-L-xylose transaminase